MTDANDPWKAVRSKTESLGLKLKLHLEQEVKQAEGVADDQPTDDGTASSADDGAGRSDARAAIEDLASKVADAFDAVGDAAKDAAVRADVKDIGNLLKDALADTFTSVSSDVGDLMKKASRSTDAPAPGDSAQDDLEDTVAEEGDTPSDG